jgi:hypothetical protein
MLSASHLHASYSQVHCMRWSMRATWRSNKSTIVNKSGQQRQGLRKEWRRWITQAHLCCIVSQESAWIINLGARF